MHSQRRHRNRNEDAGRGEGREQRSAQHRCEYDRPETTFAVAATEPTQQRDLALLDPVAELREQRGQHRQRPEDRCGDDEDRAHRDTAEAAGAGEEHAADRCHDGCTRDENRAARCRGGGEERRLGGAAGGTLLTFATDVEQGVVDADREPDQQHHRVDGSVDREQMAGQEHQPDGGDDRRQREKNRQQRCSERAECEQQDEHGRGDREDLGAVQVAVGRVHGDVAETRRAELSDPEPCLCPLG